MRARLKLSSLIVLGAALTGAALAAERIETTGEGALVIAARLVEEGKLDEAEVILKTLAAGDAEHFDMRPVDALAAKIAFLRGDKAEVRRILEALVAHEPENQARRFDLIQLLMAEREDRAARKQIRILLSQDPPPQVAAKLNSDLALLDDRRVIRLSVEAAAAPSSNINSATRNETFELFGFLPAQLSDDARQQSGVGVSYGVSGAVTPQVAEGVQARLAVRGRMADYGNADYDQASVGAEAGIRLMASNKVSGIVSATADQQFFAGEDYAHSFGARAALQRATSRRLTLSGEVAVRNVTYEDQSGRDGPVYILGTQASYAAHRRVRVTAGAAALREATEAESLANTQYTGTAGIIWATPWRLNLGVQPEITFRRFDKAAAIYGERREDMTVEVSADAQVRGLRVGGFSPSVSYRYTDNESTVDLFDYDRHAVDIGFSRAF